MSLELLLLGALRDPASGYRIKQDFDRRFGSFWSAELSQIYRTLKALEKKGFLKSRVQTSDRGPSKRVYRRTRRGHSHLLSELGSKPHIGYERVPYLAQLFYLGELDDLSRTLELLNSVRDHHAAQVRLLGGGVTEDGDADGAGGLHAALVADHAEAHSRAVIAWAETAIARVQTERRRRSRAQRRRG